MFIVSTYCRCLPITSAICCIIVAVVIFFICVNIPSFSGVNVSLIVVVMMFLCFSCACCRLGTITAESPGPPNYAIVTPPSMMMPPLPHPPPYSLAVEYSMPPAYSVISNSYNGFIQPPYTMQHTAQWNRVQWNSTTIQQEQQQPSMISFGGIHWQQQHAIPLYTTTQQSLPISSTMPNVPSGIFDTTSSSSRATPELSRRV